VSLQGAVKIKTVGLLQDHFPSSVTSLCALFVGSLGRDKSHLLNGKGPIDSLLGRDNRCLLDMRLASNDCATSPCGSIFTCAARCLQRSRIRFLGISS
jgi:hypothetical protein